MALVSISCITYNHAPYIRQCLDGFLMQECDFDFEILIHDDASTDGTSEIIREYQEKYPDIIKPIIQAENQWSKGVRGINAKFNFSRAKGKYIALCEGDDYWTDPLKLQKQVDFLEKNPEYSLVCGGFTSINTKTGEEEIIIKNIEDSTDNTIHGFEITIERFFKQWLTKTLTLTFRKDYYNPSDFENYKYTRDVHINYHLLKRGKGYYMKEVFGTYHVHDGGIFSLMGKHEQINQNYLVYKEIHVLNPNDKFAYKRFKAYLTQAIKHKTYNTNKYIRKSQLLRELFLGTKDFKSFIKNIKILLHAFKI